MRTILEWVTNGGWLIILTALAGIGCFIEILGMIKDADKHPMPDSFEPKFDRAYLDECIKKATPNLSKIKDVDKELGEIMGIDEHSVDAHLSDKVDKNFSRMILRKKLSEIEKERE